MFKYIAVIYALDQAIRIIIFRNYNPKKGRIVQTFEVNEIPI